MSCCRCLCVLCLISILVIPYSVILVDCSPLIFRLILQSILFWSTLLAVLYAHTVRTITKRLETGLPDQRAKVLKVRKIPTTPHPQMEQKIFCWIQLLNGNNHDEETPSAPIGGTIDTSARKDAAQQQQLHNNPQSSSSQAEADEKTLRDSEALLQDLREWAHVPCVLVSNDMNPKPGDVIHVCMIDGDLTRPIHVPFQMQMREKLKGFIVKKVRACLLALLGLYLLFGTIYMTSFDSFHESTLQAPVVKLFNSFFPDNNNQSSTTEDHWFCTITTGVSTSYDMLILIQITIPVGLFILFMIIKGKQGLGLEEPSPDSYQLLRDDDEFEGVTTGTEEEQGGSVQQPTAAPAAAATKTRVTPYGQYTAVSVTGN